MAAPNANAPEGVESSRPAESHSGAEGPQSASRMMMARAPIFSSTNTFSTRLPGVTPA